jgi:uncharacterized repeat protein (TIGR01451 family)
MKAPRPITDFQPAGAALIWFCVLTLILLLASIAAQAQPSTTTVQNGGSPNAANPQVVSNYTVPRAGIVLTGTALNARGFPVRHLWVGDNVMGFCRVDPDLDTPGIRVINPSTCPFKLNGLSLVGGPASYDPATNFIYIADARRSLGVFRMKYDPSADGGNGNIDLTSIFGMAGNQTGARFQGGQTGCPLPNGAVIGGVALAPDGNLWATQGKGGFILRINNPATATDTGFGTCADFVQIVATSPDGRLTGDLAWIGHDLWSVDGTSPFVIHNADTTCQAMSPGMTPTCVATNTLAAVGAANTTGSDQIYPYLNGNDLYYGLSAVAVAPTAPGQLFWVADVNGAQTVDPNFINPADIAASLLPTQPVAFPLGAMSQATVDYNDPANLVVYTGDDPSNNGVTIPPTVSGAPGLGLGRWWQSCLGTPPVVPDPFATNLLGVNNCPTPAASAIPGAPTVTRARATGSQAVVSWSAAQSQRPVTSYHIRSFLNGVLLSDSIVTPGAGSAFPATNKTFTGLANGSYTFQVSAINAIGESAFSQLSNAVVIPEIDPPGIPTRLTAIAGNASALVSWSAPAQTGGAPIGSYTVTVIQQSIRTATTVTVAAPDTSAVITGLSNGTNYSFTVHATNAGGNGMESTPSNLVTPTASAGAVSVSIAGPALPDAQFLPSQVTFNVSVTNTTPNAISNTSVINTLTQALPDGAFIVLAQPTQGSCSAGGIGVLITSCPLGTLGPLATATINVVVQIQANTATLDAAFSGTDVHANPVAAFGTFTLAPPPPPPPPTDIQITGSASNGGPTVTGTLPAGAPDTYTWQIKNAQNVTAPNVKFTDILPGSLKFDSVTLSPGAIGTCSAPAVGSLGGTVTCNIPAFGGPGNVNQFTIAIAVHVVQTGTIQNSGSAAYKSDTNNANNNFTVTIKAK